MSDFLNIVSALREQMNANLSRSDILRPLAWVMGILVFGLIGVLLRSPPSWLLVVMVAFIGTALIIYLGSHIFCLFKDRDALRSERYSLQKMAIEHGVFGDSTRGIIDAESPKNAALPAPDDAVSKEQ
jgi:uncharacterized protein YacL